VKRFGALLFLVFSAGVAGSVGQPVAAAKAPTVVRATAVLAIVAGQQPKLVWLNPRTLKRLKRGAVVLPGYAGSPVFSPTGGRVALGGSDFSGIRIVDVFRMKLVSRMSRRAWEAAPIAWPTDRRLLALEANPVLGVEALIVVDPVSRRVLRRIPIDGFSSWLVAGRDVVSVGGPAEGIGPARLRVIGLDGTSRAAVLDRIPAGGGQEGSEEDPAYRVASPGLALDPAARRAYVVGQAPLVAEIDLDSLLVTYRELSRPASLLGRFLNWLEPAAQAKVVTGWHRQAVWLGDGLLAVAGTDYDRLRRVPAGLELVDVRAGTLRRLEDRASFVLTAGGLLLAAGAANDGRGGAWSGMGVAAYTPDGEELWRALGGEPVSWLQTAGGYAYVDAPNPPVRVIDLGTGAVRKVRTRIPFFVTR
jgi:hypothetical protein